MHSEPTLDQMIPFTPTNYDIAPEIVKKYDNNGLYVYYLNEVRRTDRHSRVSWSSNNNCYSPISAYMPVSLWEEGWRSIKGIDIPYKEIEKLITEDGKEHTVNEFLNLIFPHKTLLYLPKQDSNQDDLKKDEESLEELLSRYEQIRLEVAEKEAESEAVWNTIQSKIPESMNLVHKGAFYAR